MKEGPDEGLRIEKLDSISHFVRCCWGVSKALKVKYMALSVVKLSFIYLALVVPKHAEQILFMTTGKICVNLDIIFEN